MTTLGAILPSPLPLRDAHLLAAHVGQFAHERWFDAWPPAEQDRWRAVTRFAAMGNGRPRTPLRTTRPGSTGGGPS